MKLVLKGGISIDADSVPLKYDLWCWGSRSQEEFTFIPIGSGHTVFESVSLVRVNLIGLRGKLNHIIWAFGWSLKPFCTAGMDMNNAFLHYLPTYQHAGWKSKAPMTTVGFLKVWGRSITTWTYFARFDHLPTSAWTFYSALNVDKNKHFLYHLLTHLILSK